MKRVLITGAAGFIGSNALEHFAFDAEYKAVACIDKLTYASDKRRVERYGDQIVKNSGDKLVLYAFDICSDKINYILKETRPDIIINFAASSHVDNSINSNYAFEFVESNYYGVINLVNCIRNYQRDTGKKIFLAHVSSVTGDTPVLIKYKDEVNLVRIDSLKDFYGKEVLTLDHTYKAKFSKIKNFICHKTNEIYKIKATGGLNLSVTGSHSVFIFRDGKLLLDLVSNLRSGDNLVSLCGDLSSKKFSNQKIRVYDFVKTLYDTNLHIKRSFDSYRECLSMAVTRGSITYRDQPYDKIRRLKNFGYLNEDLTPTDLCIKDYTTGLDTLLSKIIKSKLKIKKDVISIDEDILWMFGLYLAEGCSDAVVKNKKRSNRVTFCIGAHEKFKADRLILIGKKLGIKPGITQRNNSMYVVFSSIWFNRIIVEYFGQNLKNKKLPNWLWNITKEELLYFMDGYSGDAAIKKNGSRTYTSAKRELLEQLAWMLRCRGISCRVGSRVCKHIANKIPPNCTKTEDKTYYDLFLTANENTRSRCFCIPKAVIPENMISKTKSYSIRESVSKERFKILLEKYDVKPSDELNKFLNSDIGISKITSITKEHKDCYVYDLSVEDNERFFGGNIPVLLHNTDEVLSDLPIDSDEEFKEDQILDPNNLYSATKAAAEQALKALHHTHKDFEYVIVRAVNNYGPNQHFEKLLPTVISKAYKNEKIPVYGKGDNVREWLWVGDFVRGIRKTIHKYLTGGLNQRILHFGSGVRKTNIEVVKTILKLMDKKEDLIEYVTDRPGHDRKYALDCTLARTLLEWKAEQDFEEGLRIVIKDIVERIKNEGRNY